MKYKSGMDWHIYLDKINPDTNKLYTEEEAKIHVKSFRKNSIYYWLKHGYSEEEAERKRMEFQHSNIYKAIDAAKKVPSNTQIEYYTQKGYSIEEAKKIISDRQRTFTLEKCIAKYGEQEGRKRWKDRQNKWMESLNKKTLEEKQQINKRKSLSITQYINRFGLKKGLNEYYKLRCIHKSDLHFLKRTIKIIYKNNFKNVNDFSKIYNKLKDKYVSYKIKGTSSRESLKVLKPLYNYCINHLNMEKSNVRLGIPGSKELCLRNHKKMFFYDFCIMDKKIIIEYNHLIWHPDPRYMSFKQFENYKHPYSKKKTASSIYNYDHIKIKYAKQCGYKVFIMWNFDDVKYKINELKNIIKNEIIH